MKKRCTKFIALCMSAALAVATVCGCFVGCKKESNTDDSPYYDPETGINLEEPISKLADNGRSEYKIVIPADAEPVEEYAAQEFQRYVLSSSNASLPIVTDAESPACGEKWISIGNTSLFKGMNINT